MNVALRAPRNRRPRPGGARGFTLLETLVAAVLIVAAISLLMTALAQTARIQSRIAEMRTQRTEFDLGVFWWRELTAGLHPAGAVDPNVFRGNSRRFSGLSIAPPTSQSPGRALPFVLAIVDATQGGEQILRYTAANQELDLLRLPADRLRFSYLSAEGESFDEWPPSRVDPPELPAAIRISVDLQGGSRALFAATGGLVRPLPRGRDLFEPNTGLGFTSR